MGDPGHVFWWRALSIQLRICWIPLVCLLLVSKPAQEPDFSSPPLPAETACLDSQRSMASSQDSSEQSNAQEKEVRADLQKGTSNDRILWTLPNFLTVENADTIPPLTPAQKFKVTARGVFDPFEFFLVGFVAGINQAGNSNPTYGQGMQGYAKRYGTAYADNAIENFMASAVFPSVLHQDPRYYQLDHGGFLRRSGHAVSRVLITRSDSGSKQPNYSELGGGITAAAISTYAYHPQSEQGLATL
jgi:hypothetical protein